MWPFMTRLRWGKLAVWTALKVKGCVFIHNSSSKDRKGEGRSHHYDFPQKNLTDYHRMAVVDDPIQCAELLTLEPPRLVQEMIMFWHWKGLIIPHPLLETPFLVAKTSMGWNSLPGDSTIKMLEIYFKHCQRHNGPRLSSLKLELSLQLKLIHIPVSQISTSCNNLHDLWQSP